jgi:hypothetical protein
MRGRAELGRSTVLCCAFLLTSAVLTGCSTPPGNSETDRIARVVADAISYPRQQSAAGYATAALATRAARDGRLQKDPGPASGGASTHPTDLGHASAPAGARGPTG